MYDGELFGWGPIDPLGKAYIEDVGDLTFDHDNLSTFPNAVVNHIKNLIYDASTLTIGGSHYITLPILKAYFDKYNKPLSLITFDAHTDLLPDDDYNRIDHGTMFYKAVKLGYIDPEKSVMIGIRTHHTYMDTLGVTIIDINEILEIGNKQVARKVKEIVGNNITYLSFDIDCLDPAFAPGTGSPVCGGISSRDAFTMIRSLSGINMVGGDIVEYSPNLDSKNITALLCGQILRDMKCLWAFNRFNMTRVGDGA